MVIAARHQYNAGVAPPALLDALSGRWQALAAPATGRVFELPSEDVEEALRSECSRHARYDTILSFMRTPQVADLDNLVSALDLILAGDGWILMMEPSGSGNRGVRGWLSPSHPERDVVSALRAGGFTVADLHRCEVASVPVRWRRYVEIRARRETPIQP
jgi:hypothetical protein